MKKEDHPGIRFQIKLGQQDRYLRILDSNTPMIQIVDTGNNQQEMTLTLQMWKLLSGMDDDINDAVNALKERREFPQLRRHLGGNVFVSVTPGFFCIDLRQFYLPHANDEEPRPTRTGMYRHRPSG